LSAHQQHPQKKPLPELLAPAGSPEAFRAAVAAGADAVYLSGKRFGARKFAQNFTDEEIEEAISFAHGRDVCVYVTINTLIHDRELVNVGKYLLWLYSIGVDAVLIQDFGVAALARRIVPELPLHASTQMTIHNSAGVLWAARQGFSRVVLARELSFEDITRIARETAGSGIGLEVFAHGALCYCYSGQCLFSSVIGGRSGNRGMCAQPCRKPYSLVTGQMDAVGLPTRLLDLALPDRFLLSPKDLCTFENLREIVASPVMSLKIEGRMKSPEYVAMVVSNYRLALDAIGNGEPFDTKKAFQDLYLAFNRGFTHGYLFKKHHTALMGRDASDNRGLPIGVVIECDERSKNVVINSLGSYMPAPGDGLLFTSPKNPDDKFGFALNTVPRKNNREIIITVPRPFAPGTSVSVTHSSDHEMRARQVISNSSVGLRYPVPVDLDVTVHPGGNVILEGVLHTRNGREIPVVYRSGPVFVPSRSHPISRKQLEQQVKKCGGTPFTIRTFTLNYDGDLFAPLAALNHVRREFLSRAKEELATASRPSSHDVKEATERWTSVEQEVSIPVNGNRENFLSSTPSLAVWTDSIEGVKKAVMGGCDSIYFEPVFTTSSCTCRSGPPLFSYESQVMTASDQCKTAGIRFVVKFPKITSNAFLDAVLPVIKKLSGKGIREVMVEQWGAAHALMQMDPVLILSGSAGLNIFNHAAAQNLSSWCSLMTLSSELSRDEIAVLVHAARSHGLTNSFALVVQGNSEAMVSEDCILQPLVQCHSGEHKTDHSEFFGIRDMTGQIFPVRTDGECRSHIYNSAELCLIDYLPSIRNAGINEVVIDARGRPETYILEITRLYLQAIYLSEQKTPGQHHQLKALKDAIKNLVFGGITTGHFIRGLKES
jgi:U32 family peptidase